MAQRAFVSHYKDMGGTANLNEITISFDATLLEETVMNGFKDELSIVVNWNDNEAQIKQKIVTAIMAFAAANNYNTLQESAIILPDYTKG